MRLKRQLQNAKDQTRPLISFDIEPLWQLFLDEVRRSGRRRSKRPNSPTMTWHLLDGWDIRPHRKNSIIAVVAGEPWDMSFSVSHLAEARAILDRLDTDVIERMALLLAELRDRKGRLFFLGVGGSAGNCGHAVNDFRKIAGIESYAPTDNVSELTARTNDEGWETVFSAWLKVSRLSADDMLFIFSVGGGNLEKNVSPNLVRALQHAKDVGAKVIGVVGRDGGYTAKVGDAVCIVPTVNPDAVTPHSEAFQAVVWHLLVTHPALKAAQTKWESTK
jgi:D-sedoheptulose 7-phosphate isomerase